MDERRWNPDGSELPFIVSFRMSIRKPLTRLCMNGARNTRIPTVSSTGNPCAERRGRETDVVGAVEHETGCGQVKVADKSNEIPAARKLLRSMQLSGRIVTADALRSKQPS